MFQSIRGLFFAGVLAFSCGVASGAETLPSTVRLVVGYPPGGSVDTVARLLAQPMAKHLGVNVIVDNHPGAGGRIAAGYVKGADPDGGTIMIAPNAVTTMASLVYAGKLNYDILKDFTPVARLGGYPFALTVSTTRGINSPQQLNDWIKAHPDHADFGSSGPGGMAHFTGLLYGEAAGVQWTHVPFNGGAPMLNALIGNHIVAGVDTVIDHYEQHRAGKVKILGVTGAERYRLAPDLPTLQEQGIEGLDISGWFGAFVPAKTPAAIVNQLDQAFKQSLAEPAFAEKLGTLMMDAAYLSSDDLRRLQEGELKQWEPIVRNSGFRPE